MLFQKTKKYRDLIIFQKYGFFYNFELCKINI